MYFVLNLINTKSTLVNNQKVHIEDLCYRPVKGKGCYRPSNFVSYLKVLSICGKWTSLIFKKINKFSTLPCVLNQEVKKVEFHVLMKMKFQSSSKQFSVELPVIKQKIKHQTLSFHAITAGSRLKPFLQLICSTTINSHRKQHKPGKETFLLTLSINITLTTALLLKNTESISQSQKMDFSTFLKESQSTWTN